MKILGRNISGILVVLAAFGATAEAQVACYDFNYARTEPVRLELNLPKANASFSTAGCHLKRIKYNPKAAKYQGWIRVGTPKDNCAAMGEALFGISKISQKPIRVYWISISREVQAGTEGAIQIGYENDVNPAYGPEAKLNLTCYPEP